MCVCCYLYISVHLCVFTRVHGTWCLCRCIFMSMSVCIYVYNLDSICNVRYKMYFIFYKYSIFSHRSNYHRQLSGYASHLQPSTKEDWTWLEWFPGTASSLGNSIPITNSSSCSWAICLVSQSFVLNLYPKHWFIFLSLFNNLFQCVLHMPLNCILLWGSCSVTLGNIESPFCCHYLQVHSHMEWLYLLDSCLWVKLFLLGIPDII